MTSTPVTWAGSRRPVPADAMKSCPECGEVRGTRRKGWSPILAKGTVVGFTCPDCPEWTEPIRRVTARGQDRFLATVNGAPVNGKRKQLRRTFDTLETARSWVEEVRTGVEAAETQGRDFIDVSKMTVQALTDRWLAWSQDRVTSGAIREGTLNGYASALASLLPLIGERVARDITPSEIEAALTVLARDGGLKGRPLSAASLRLTLTVIRQVFAFGERERWLSGNPASLAQAPKAKHSARSEVVLKWSPDELRKFRQYLDALDITTEPWVKAAYRLTLSGLRRSEVLGLGWENVDFDTGTIEVTASRTKTGRGNATTMGDPKVENSRRTVEVESIHSGTVAALRALWMIQGQPKAGLVVRDAAGHPVHPDTYSKRFRRLCIAAEVPVLRSIHNVRHSIATALKDEAVPDHHAAEMLGHDEATYRKFYVVADGSGSREAALVTGRVFA